MGSLTREDPLRRNSAPAARLTAGVPESLQVLDQALALFDTEDHLVFCNGAFSSLIGGAPAGALAGLHYEQFLDNWLFHLAFATDADRARFRAERVFQRRAPRSDFDVRTNEGRSLRVSQRRAPDGTLAAIIHDRTETEDREAEQRAALAAAEAASTAKSQFLGSLSHELRTPLNALLGFAQLMQRDLKQPLPERHRPRLEQILKAGDHLLHIIEDLLDLSRIEAGQVSIATEPVSVWNALQQLHSTLAPSATSAGIQLELIKPSSDGTPNIAADPVRFSQILLNFGSNAIKYNRPHGHVRFVVSVPQPRFVRVSVQDTGLGIPADQHFHIFDAFQRAGQERGEIEGTGLGLAITKRLALLMDGAVGFESVLGRGSEFWVDMPVYRAES